MVGFLEKLAKKFGSLFHDKQKALIKADVRLISACEDAQTSADVSNMSSFALPDPAGRAGGACTSTLLKILYECNENQELTFLDVLLKTRNYLKNLGLTQIPQMSATRKLDMHQPFYIVPPLEVVEEGENQDQEEGENQEDQVQEENQEDKHQRVLRSLLIGINYTGIGPGELSGCHNDVQHMKDYIMEVQGFKEENMKIMLDDNKHESPTKANIMAAFQKLVDECKSGDVVFIHYSGHGGKLPDDDFDEDDGFDETLIPVDYAKAGQIRDDDIFDTLVVPMASGVTVTCLFDCCHSGTILDLPYNIKADGKNTNHEMELDKRFNFHIKIDRAIKGLEAEKVVES